ncbi:MAG: MIP family channel protein [Cellulomonadaceae bacterium]|nr:MIP family channel protein [Cellulomonadaceae bacterium]
MSSTEPTSTPTSPDEVTPAVTVESPEVDRTEIGAYELDVVRLVTDGPRQRSLVVRAGAEVFGTFALVLTVVGVLLYTSLSSVGTVGVALACGLDLAGVTALLSHDSGDHLNPAVTLGAAILGRTRWLDALVYVVAQVFGGLVAAAVLLVSIPKALPTALGIADSATMLGTTVNGWDALSPLSVLSTAQVTFGLTSALIVEAVASAILVAVVLGTSRRSLPSAPVVIGLTYSAMILLASPVTNAALNPARATAVAVLTAGADTAALGQLWGFWLAPLLGGAAAGLAILAFGSHGEEIDPAELELSEDDEDEATLIDVR